MILCDTGVIVAALNDRDKNNKVSLQALGAVNVPYITTLPCLTEALHLIRIQAGPNALNKLLQQIKRRVYDVPPLTIEHIVRSCELMEQYADTPMDFADASLVVVAETFGITKILTFDRHFYAYRVNGKTPFEVLPTPS